MPHVCARFGPGGQLLKVIPNLPSEGQPALVEIHSLEVSIVLSAPYSLGKHAFLGSAGLWGFLSI